MPKRVIDFDAMWGSDKLASCAEWAQAEYAWLYGLADASGCFELTNLRVIWGRVAAIRRNLSLERLEQVFHEFQDKGLLFVWEEHGKRYGHWTGSDVPGRLPAPSWRVRLERLAPPVPKQQLAEFVSRFSRGRAASPGGGFFGSSLQAVDRASPKHIFSDELPIGTRGKQIEPATVSGGLPFGTQGKQVEPAPGEEELNGGLESAQGQDLKWDRNQEKEGFTLKPHAEGKGYDSRHEATVGEISREQPYLPNINSNSEIPVPEPAGALGSQPGLNHSSGGLQVEPAPVSGRLPFGTQGKQVEPATFSGGLQVEPAPGVRAVAAGAASAGSVSYSRLTENAQREWDKSSVVSRELIVGQGPRCGPVRVRPEVLERIRRRDSSRSP